MADNEDALDSQQILAVEAGPSCSTPNQNLCISNRQMFEFVKENKKLDSADLVKKYRDLYERDTTLATDSTTIYNALKSLHKKVTYDLRGKKREEFLSKTFVKPKSKAQYLSDMKKESPIKRGLRIEIQNHKKENTGLKRKLDASFEKLTEVAQERDHLLLEYEDRICKIAEMEDEYGLIVKEMVDEKAASEQLSSRLADLQEKYAKAMKDLADSEAKVKSTQVKSLKKKIKKNVNMIEKKNAKISELKKERKSQTSLLKTQEELLSDHREKLAKKEIAINALKKEKQNLQSRLWYYQGRVNDIQVSLSTTRNDLEQEHLQLHLDRNKLELKEKELDYLQTMLEDDVIKNFEDGKYLDHIRSAIMELLSMNVSVNKVNDVIRIVLKNFAGKEIDRLPSKGLLSQFLIEARHIADIQVGETMLKDIDLTSVLGNTLHGDGTTKYNRHYQNFQISTKDGDRMSVGLMETVGQDAATILKCWKERVEEIAKATSSQRADNDVEKCTNELITSVKNTMSDQVATNGVFNTLLADLRKEVLPNIVENWQCFSEDQRNNLIGMGNFFCKIHPLITFAEECNKSLLQFENACLENYKSKFAMPSGGGESGAVRLIRTACSAFQKRGNQAAGQSADFLAYLDELGEALKLIQMEGNRFNVIFHNGAAVYYHILHMKGYIDGKLQRNRLLSAVAEDLENQVYVAGLRALGLISKFITEPYFKVVGQTEGVLNLNPHL